MEHSSFLSVPTSQDTLHTPQIIPPVEPIEPPQILESTKIVDTTTVPTTTTNDIPKVEVPTITITSSNHMIPIAPKPTTVAITHPITLLPKSNIIYATPLLASDLTSTINNAAPKTSESVKNKLKNILLSNSAVQQNEQVNRIKTQTIPTLIIGAALPLIAAPANLIINEQPKIESFSKPTNDKPQQRKPSRRTSSESKGGSQKTERNRAAAKRYRWVMM